MTEILKCFYSELKGVKNRIIWFSLYLVSLYLFVLYNGGDRWSEELTRFYITYHFFATLVFLALLTIQIKKQFSLGYKKELLVKYKNLLSCNDNLERGTTKLYWVNNIVIVCTVFLPYIIFSFLSTVVVDLYRGNYGDDLYYCRIDYLYKLSFTLVIALIYYIILVFLVTSTKKMLIEIVVPFFMFISVPMLFITTSYLYSEFVNFGLEYIGISYEVFLIYGFFMSLVASAVLFICSYRNYVNNEVDSSAFYVNTLPKKIYITIFIAVFNILIYAMLATFEDYWIISLVIINTIICFIVIKILRLKQNWSLYLISLILSIVYFSVIIFDVFQVGNSAPKVSTLRDIYVENVPISTELYNEVRDLQEMLWSDEFSDTETPLYITKESMIDIIQIDYSQKDGAVVTRYYNVDNPKFYEKFKSIVEREENKDYIVEKVKAYKGNEVPGESFVVKYKLYGENSTSYFEVFDDRKVTYDDLEYVVNIDFGAKDEIVNNLLIDIENDKYFTSFDETQVTVGSIRFVSRNREMVEVVIKGSYTNTLEYFSNYLAKDNVPKTFEDNYIVVAKTIGEDIALEEAIKNNNKNFEVNTLRVVDIGLDLFNTQKRYYYSGDFELQIDDSLQEEVVEGFSECEDLEVKDIIFYNDESERYLDYIKNKVVYYNIKGIIPVEEDKQLYYVYEVSRPSFPSYMDHTSVKFLGVYYE